MSLKRLQVPKKGKKLYVPWIKAASPDSSDRGAALPLGSKYEMSMLQVNEQQVRLFDLFVDPQLNSLAQYENMQPNNWGIPMPQDPGDLKDALNPELPLDDALDLLFLPASAYDKNFTRLGRGKGFYDRYLVKVQAYAEQSGRPMPLIGMSPFNIPRSYASHHFLNSRDVSQRAIFDR